jgi:hypothetical protein
MFMIKDKNMLEEKFLPRYFASHKCASFARQLHIYGFEKVYSRELLLASGVHDLQNSSHIVAYHHTSFQRGKQEALKHIVPSKRNITNQQSAAAAAAAPAAAARKETDGTTGVDAVDDDNPESGLQIMRNDLNLIVERVSSLEELLHRTTEVCASQMNTIRQGAANFRRDLAGRSLSQSAFFQYTSNRKSIQDSALTQDRCCQRQYNTQKPSMPPPTANHCPISPMNMLMPSTMSLSSSMLESPGNNVDDHWSGRALGNKHAAVAPRPAYGNAQTGGIDAALFGSGVFERNLVKGELIRHGDPSLDFVRFKNHPTCGSFDEQHHIDMTVGGITDGNILDQNSTTCCPSSFATAHAPGIPPNREFSKLVLRNGSVNEEDDDVMCGDTPSFPVPDPLSVSEQEASTTTDYFDWNEMSKRLA